VKRLLPTDFYVGLAWLFIGLTSLLMYGFQLLYALGGITLGAVEGVLLARHLTKRVETEGMWRISWPELAATAFLGAAMIYVLISFGLSLGIFSTVYQVVMWLPSATFLSRAVYLRDWERRGNRRLYSEGTFRPRVFAISKNSSLDNRTIPISP